ncbi:MAG TPA: pyridoxine 5'-phosphate synthase [Candidatus Binataceae bacterium]|nr:pyridoxine 5'-phosphate synthase [Candidatus Binataceae bacterium]
MIRLSVNLNKIAVLRNSRGGTIPDVLTAARTCIAAGCHGITVHPRPDARHITRQDVFDLSQMLKAEYKRIEFNIEGYPSPEFIELVSIVKPSQCTLVPDPPGVLTSNAGWQLGREDDWLRSVLQGLGDTGIRTSLFVDPDQRIIERARELSSARIELFTAPYATAFGTSEANAILLAHRDAARLARKLGLGVNAGHDLNLQNIPRYAATVKGLAETSIGHALIADALYLGLTRSVRAYLKALGSRAFASGTQAAPRQVRKR